MPDYLYRAAKYVAKSFNLFDEAFSVHVTAPSAFESLGEAFDRFAEREASEHQAPADAEDSEPVPGPFSA